MGARVYLPSIGRFAQVDPVPGGNANNYVYAVDPINTSDYSGMFLQGGPGAGFLQPTATPQWFKPSVGLPVVQSTRKITLTVKSNPAPKRSSPPPPKPPAPNATAYLTQAAKAWQESNFVAGDGTFNAHFSASVGFTNADFITKGIGIKFSPDGIKFTTQVGPSWPMGIDSSFTMSDKSLPGPGCTMEGSVFTPLLIGGSASSGKAIDPGIGSFGGSYVHSCVH